MNIGKGCCWIVDTEFSFFCLLLYIDWWFHVGQRESLGWFDMFVCGICMRVCTFWLFVNMAFWIHVWFYTLNAIVDTFFLSIHSVLMFRFASSSMKENSKLTAVQNNSRRGDLMQSLFTPELISDLRLLLACIPAQWLLCFAKNYSHAETLQKT